MTEVELNRPTSGNNIDGVIILTCSPWVLLIVGSSPGQVKPMTMKLIDMMFRRQKTEFIGAIADIGWLLIKIVCPREETYLLFQ